MFPIFQPHSGEHLAIFQYSVVPSSKRIFLTQVKLNNHSIFKFPYFLEYQFNHHTLKYSCYIAEYKLSHLCLCINCPVSLHRVMSCAIVLFLCQYKAQYRVQHKHSINVMEWEDMSEWNLPLVLPLVSSLCSRALLTWTYSWSTSFPCFTLF